MFQTKLSLFPRSQIRLHDHPEQYQPSENPSIEEKPWLATQELLRAGPGLAGSVRTG